MLPEEGKKTGEKLRVFVFDDEPVMRSMFKRICVRRGYEVWTFSSARPGKKCRCKGREVCADIVISDVNMPGIRGVDFFANGLMQNCKAKKMALISGAWKDDDLHKARSFGCQIFHKPIDRKVLDAWLDECDKEIDPSLRVLASWFLDDASENSNGEAA